MAENLKVTHYNNGDEIPTGLNNDAWASTTDGAYAVYDDDPANAEVYGNLYNGYAIDDSRGICPENFHVPSDDEWLILTDFIAPEGIEEGNSISIVGGKMKEAGLDHWNSPNTGATNESGFTGLPAGYRNHDNGYYLGMGDGGYFWSNNENPGYGRFRYLYYSNSDVTQYDGSRHYGFSIRCLQDEITTGCTDPYATNYDETANVDDGSCCIELWGECYNIEETTELDLYDSGLTGEIPPEIGQLTNLYLLILSQNQLNGEIPPEIGNCINLSHLDLRGNQLSEEIPLEIGELINLHVLDLDNNQLIGEIPESIWSLTNLEYLWLNENYLIGEIPVEIGNLTNLTGLGLNLNQFTGEIPVEIGNLTSLTELYLSNNQLTGEIPQEVCDLIESNNLNMEYILDGNNLTNTCEETTLCDGLTEVELWGEYYDIEETTYLVLSDSDNPLTGEIPPEIGCLTNLTILYLNSNQLTGEIPSELGNLINLERLKLDSNELTGSIPESIGNLVNLVDLNLNNNQLNGEIPQSIGNLLNLEWLNLNDNQLSGFIPNVICELYNNLFDHNFANNHFCRPYPTCLTEEDLGNQNTSDCPQGCTHPNASNYNPEVYVDDGSCEYETVQIGHQVWMTENLKATHYRNGDAIATGLEGDDWYYATQGAYSIYDNDPTNAGIYGNLYNWYAVDDGREICSENYHVPSDDEFKQLEIYLGMTSSQADNVSFRGTNEGSKLAGNDSLWISGDLENNSEFEVSGFSVFPAGLRDRENGEFGMNGGFGMINLSALYWTNTEIGIGAYHREIVHNQTGINRYEKDMSYGFSIRCLSDETQTTTILVPENFTTIQEAINYSIDGDTILVSAGTYYEYINFNGKNIALIGEDRETTIIDGGMSNRLVYIESSDLTISGFTLQNGYSLSQGGAFYIGDDGDNDISHILLDNLIIKSNTCLDEGGAFLIRQRSVVTISNSIIDGNTGGRGGAMLIGEASFVTLDNVAISNNRADSLYGGAIAISDRADMNINNCIIINNYSETAGGAIWAKYTTEDSTVVNISSTQISNNFANSYGGGLYIADGAKVNIYSSLINKNEAFINISNGIYISNIIIDSMISDIAIKKSTIVDYINIAQDLSIVQISNSIIWSTIHGYSDGLELSYSNIDGGWEGEENIDGDPQFTDPENGDFTLQPTSPCIDAGDPESELDPDGSRSDMGAYPFFHIWGCIDESACSYDADANTDDGNCTYPNEDNCFCEFNKDCTGICGGTAIIDDCGYCTEGTTELDYNYFLGCDDMCIGTQLDCAGECGGEAVVDDCGDCDGSNANMDACGVCNGDNTTCCLDEGANNYLEDGICEYHYTIELHAGANLVSFWALPDDNSLDSVFIDLDGIITGIIGEGTAAVPNALLGWIGSLSEISCTSGYWITVSEDVIWDIIATELCPCDLVVYEIQSGNNLVSWPSSSSCSVQDAIPDDYEPYITGIIGEGVAAYPNETFGWVGSLVSFQSTKGYWLGSSIDMYYNWDACSCSGSFSRIATDDNKINSEYFNQSTKQAFYFIESIENIAIGDWILAYNDDEVIGAREWTGTIIDVPAMGDDGSDYTDGYMKAGEVPSFKILRGDEFINLEGDIPAFENNQLYMVESLTEAVALPETFSLDRAYPNPFNPTTTLSFAIPVDSEVFLSVYNLQGREVCRLIDKNMDAGYHSIVWDANSYSSGVYFVKMVAGEFVNTQKLMLVK